MRREQEGRVSADLKRKIVLLAGPRQTGKTTLSKQLGVSTAYLNFDRAEDRSLLMAKEWDRTVALVVFDELHKMRRWKAWLKGVYDTEGVAPAHLDTILREDLINLERVRDVRSIEILVELLFARVGSTVSLASLARELQVSSHTVKHWLQILENLYVLFPVRPYHRNIARSIVKEPKYYFYDTGAVANAGADPGAVLENAVACALLRELQLVEDQEGRKSLAAMKTAYRTEYGSPDVLSIREVPTPEPRAGELVVRVRAATVNRKDCGALWGTPYVFSLGSARLQHPRLLRYGG